LNWKVNKKLFKIAAAALYLSLKVLSKSHATQMPKWTSTLQHYSTYKTHELKPVVQKMAMLAKNASAAKQKAVYNKYALSKFDRISTRAEINTGTVIEQILREVVATS
jgi:Cyclin, C-terminal domain